MEHRGFDLPAFRAAFRAAMEGRGYPPTLAEKLSLLALEALQKAHGGERVYVHSSSRDLAMRRAEMVLTGFRGDYHATAKATGYSVKHVYKLVRKYFNAK